MARWALVDHTLGFTRRLVDSTGSGRSDYHLAYALLCPRASNAAPERLIRPSTGDRVDRGRAIGSDLKNPGRSGARFIEGAPIWEMAQQFPILSCDIFDTAVRRILARSEDVLLAAGARLRQAGIIACEPDAFAIYRQTAERTARARAVAAGYDEVRIEEVYAELHATGIVSDPLRGARLEFEAECAVCRPVQAIQEALLARAAYGTPAGVVFASDSILPGAWLAELLRSCGYGDGCRVFASSDLRLGKYTGRLFPAMVEDLGRAPGDILHIGDNPDSDVARPRAYGIAARQVKRPRPSPETNGARHYVVRLADSLQRTAAAEQAGPQLDQAADDGLALAAFAAPLLIGFGLFVLAHARERGLSRIFFLARDGHLPLAIVRRLLDRSGEAERFKLTYLHVSRQSLTNDPGASAYLEQSGFSRPGPRAIVDLGWRGSIQTALAQRTGLPESDLFGCYVGLWADALRPGLNLGNAAGYLYAFGYPAPLAACVREAYVVLEMIFSAPHGTVLRYDRAADGTLHPAHLVEAGPAGDTRRAVFAAMEAACMETFEALDGILGGAWPAEIDGLSALSPMESLLTRPTRAEFELVNRVPFLDTEDGKLLPAVNPLPLHEALRGPRRALRRLDNAPWRAGAVRAALPWPVPGMSYQELNDRAMRVLGLGKRIRGMFGRAK